MAQNPKQFREIKDINDELPVIQKVKCSGQKVDARRGFKFYNEKCAQVYLRIVAMEEKASELDKVATKTECPVCGCEEFENITKYEVSSDGFRVIIKKNETW